MKKLLIILFFAISTSLYSQTIPAIGGVAYNITNDPTKVAVAVKAMTNFKIYNNTFYSTRTPEEAGRGLIDVFTNYDLVPSAPSRGTKIFNNIFYTKHQIINININDNDCLPEFESDYNLFYCEDGTPLFKINNVKKTFAQWQALGYDTHSVVVNPNFINTTDFVPGAHLNYGTDLGSTWQIGLSTNATWGTTDPEVTAQNGTWQVGARIYGASSTIPVYTSSVVENATPTRLEMTYTLSLANIMPAASAFTVRVNSVARTVNSIAISGAKVLLTLANAVVYGDVVTVAYAKPITNPLQTTSGGQAASISAQTVTNKVTSPNPVFVSSSINNTTPAVIEMTYSLSLANIVPATYAFTVLVNSVARMVNYVAISGIKVMLTLSSPVVYGDVVTITYIKPSSNPLQTASGGQAVTISAQPVVNNCINAANTPPVVTISNPSKGTKYENPTSITIDAVASDPDGTISKVEFYSGTVKLVELTSAPYTYIWKDVKAGTYSITAIATDNLNASTTSLPIEFEVGHNIKYDANSEIINLYPNPNDGHFSIEFINSLQNEKSKIVITDLAGKQAYNGPVSKEETLKQFDLSNIKSGIYVMMIIDKEVLVTKKFIIK